MGRIVSPLTEHMDSHPAMFPSSARLYLYLMVRFMAWKVSGMSVVGIHIIACCRSNWSSSLLWACAHCVALGYRRAACGVMGMPVLSVSLLGACVVYCF